VPQPPEPTEVLAGAEPFAFPGGDGPEGRTGVLLVHGFTASPMSMRPWGEHLAAAGFAVRCPLLPGHGTRWQDCNLVTEDDWTTAVGEAFDALAEDVDRVVVAGLSMGGTLAIRLAELRPDDVAALILVNPSLLTQRLDAKLLPLLARLTGSWAPIASDIKKPGVTELAYERTPVHAMHSQLIAWKNVIRDLPEVTQPVLLLHSAEDHVVPVSSSELVVARISSTDVTEILLHESYHVATLDNDAPRIFEESVAFIERLSG
jgi:esterase/lipase